MSSTRHNNGHGVPSAGKAGSVGAEDPPRTSPAATAARQSPTTGHPKIADWTANYSDAATAALVVADSLDAAEIAYALLRACEQFFAPRLAALLELDATGTLIRCVAATGQRAEHRRSLEQPLASSPAARAFAEKIEIIDGSTSSKNAQVWFPLVHEGELLGVLEISGAPALFRGARARLDASRTPRGRAPRPRLGPAAARDLRLLTRAAAMALAKARHVDQMRELIITDDCTGLYNSRHLYQVLEMEIHRSDRFAYPFSCLFIDLDHFKRVNDTYGHLVGSRLLRAFGDLMRAELRKIDYLFRYGGDEFVIVLPQTPKESALTVAERLLARVRNERFLAADGLAIHITASIGLVSFPEDAKTKESVVRSADEMMYQIKNSSRDGVGVAGRMAHAAGAGQPPR